MIIETTKLSDGSYLPIFPVPIKLMLIGHGGSGKTGALASLAAAGLKLRFLDFDNGTPILTNLLSHPLSPYFKKNPQALSLLHSVPLTDTKRPMGGKLRVVKPQAWVTATQHLAHWKAEEKIEGETERRLLYDLGKPFEWGTDTVLVVDSLSAASRAAYFYHLGMNAGLMADRNARENQRDIGATQGYIIDLLELLKDSSLKCHVVVISHIKRATLGGQSPSAEDVKESKEDIFGFPSSIGSAIAPMIGTHFNTILQTSIIGGKQFILTKTTGEVGTKTTAPYSVKDRYPVETGLLDYFKAVSEV